MELREIQKPLKDRYREDPDASKITLKADGAQALRRPPAIEIELLRSEGS
jgi:hypothetical protein